VLLPPFVRESREDCFVSCHRLASSAFFLDSRARSVAINRETHRSGLVALAASTFSFPCSLAEFTPEEMVDFTPNGRLIPRARGINAGN